MGFGTGDDDDCAQGKYVTLARTHLIFSLLPRLGN